MITKKNIEDFFEIGFFYVDHFLPEATAQRLLEKCEQIRFWDKIEQTRDHYRKGGPFACQASLLPTEEDLYSKKNETSNAFDRDIEWQGIFRNEILTQIENAFKCKIAQPIFMLQKYSVGSYSRIHTDDYRNGVEHVDIGFIYYLNRRWVWDWGGLLLACTRPTSEEMLAIAPKHNRITIINHQMRPPHAVTPVTDWAKEARYGLTGFLGCDRRLNIQSFT